MDPNNYVSKDLFENFRETVNRRLKELEAQQNESSKEITEINTNVQLLLQKVDNLIETYTESAELLHQRIGKTKQDIKKLEEELNDHVNVQPSQDFKALKTQLTLQVIGYIVLGLLGTILVFK